MCVFTNSVCIISGQSCVSTHFMAISKTYILYFVNQYCLLLIIFDTSKHNRYCILIHISGNNLVKSKIPLFPNNTKKIKMWLHWINRLHRQHLMQNHDIYHVNSENNKTILQIDTINIWHNWSRQPLRKIRTSVEIKKIHDKNRNLHYM